MKTKREIELEVQLYEARDMLLRSNHEILMRDKEANDQLLSNARFELDKIIQQEEKSSEGQTECQPDVVAEKQI